MKRSVCLFVISFLVLAAASPIWAQTSAPPRAPAPGASATAGSPDPSAPRTIDGVDTVFMEEMTWMDVINGVKLSPLTDTQANGRKTPILALMWSSPLKTPAPIAQVKPMTCCCNTAAPLKSYYSAVKLRLMLGRLNGMAAVFCNTAMVICFGRINTALTHSSLIIWMTQNLMKV